MKKSNIQIDSKYKPGEQGQSMLELAISLVFLLILLAGTADIGRAFFTYITLRDAAQEGAAFASIDPTGCDRIEHRIRTTSNQPIDLNGTDVNVEILIGGSNCWTATASQACFGNEVKVTVIYPNFRLVTPFLGTFIGAQSIPISASVRDTILSPACP